MSRIGRGQSAVLAALTAVVHTQGMLEWRFEPVSATALRVVVGDSNDHAYSRVIELEGYTS